MRVSNVGKPKDTRLDATLIGTQFLNGVSHVNVNVNVNNLLAISIQDFDNSG